MTRFENKLCPVCRTRFNEKADIVCCPVCGTPHHRACYSIRNKCALEELHESGWSWQGQLPDEQPENAKSSSETADVIEPEITVEKSDGMPFEEEQHMFEQMGEGNPFAEMFTELRDKEIGEDGVSMHELVAYSATSIFHYGRAFNVFRSRADGKKHRVFFNFCSGIMAPMFQFYRRMNIFGVVALLLKLLPIFVVALTPEATLQANLMAFQGFVQFANVAVMLLFCLFGDYFYYRHCVKQIVKFRAGYDGDTKSDDYYLSLYECGKPTFFGGAVGALAMMFGVAISYMLSAGAV